MKIKNLKNNRRIFSVIIIYKAKTRDLRPSVQAICYRSSHYTYQMIYYIVRSADKTVIVERFIQSRCSSRTFFRWKFTRGTNILIYLFFNDHLLIHTTDSSVLFTHNFVIQCFAANYYPQMNHSHTWLTCLPFNDGL